MPKAIDFTGQKVGRLTVLQFGEHRRTISGVSKRYWLCKCDCGNTCMIESQCLSTKKTKSCGCLKLESDKTKKNHLKHGKSKTRLYKIWIDIKRRCDDEWRESYKYYGGRGITYCNEWRDFDAFEKWSISHGYANDLSIDRIDVNGNYEPKNCRWVTNTIQANNTRRNHYLTYSGKNQSMAEWAREYNLPYEVLRDRINRLNWDIEKALTTPVGFEYKNRIMLTYNGKCQSINQWSKELGISRKTISTKLQKGLPIEQILIKKELKTTEGE